MTFEEVKGGSGYRRYLPEPDSYPLSGIETKDVYSFSKQALVDPRVSELFDSWAKSLETPFFGLTTDGTKRNDLYKLENEGAPTLAAVIAANQLIDQLTVDEKLRALHPLEGEDWRRWSNTEIIAFDIGLRLEAIDQPKIDLVWELVRASLSEIGYTKIKNAVKMNHFLGDLASNHVILNENSYFFMMFGRPSQQEPWGFSLSGHHLCLHVFFIGNQMVVGPTFIGCEPNIIDEGPNEGIELFQRESTLALRLMQSLTPTQQSQAQKTPLIHEPEKPGWNIVDQRHYGGTGKDNAVVPYEGVIASTLSPENIDLLVLVIAAFHELLPSEPLSHLLGWVRQHLDETYFTWTGGFGDGDAFYFRIQSPVIFVELDHHTGIYLTNKAPEKYHTHTIQRLPNGNDYGRELIRQWKEAHPGMPPMKRMEYTRPLNDEYAVVTGFPKYRAQILSTLESGIILASVIGEGGCGPGLHYHHVDQLYYLVRGTMKVRLGDEVHDVATGSLVFIPAGLPHCNWNEGPGTEFHLEMIIPSPHRLAQIAYLIEKPEEVPKERRTKKKGYVRTVSSAHLKELLPGFRLLPLADPSVGSEQAVVLYAEVEPGTGGPRTHIHEFDQYYFVLEGELTIEVALQKQIVKPNTLVILPAGVPHRQYNQGNVTEKHIAINSPAPEPGRFWDYGLDITANGDNHYGNLNAAREVEDTFLAS